MQHSKTKTWANDDVPRPPELDSPAEQPAEVEEQPQELTYAQRKKAKLGDDHDHSQEMHTADREAHGSPEPMVVDHSGEGNAEAPAEQDDTVAETEAPAVSDADWLRSKTSRLLGLLDEEEQADFDAAAQHKESAAPEEAEDPAADSRDAQIVAPAATEAKTVQEPQVDTNIESIRLSARLFVRNLAYDTSESDLEPLFSPFGRIEEVSKSMSFVSCHPRPPTQLNDDRPDRDIRCKAHDVTRKEYFSRCLLLSEELHTLILLLDSLISYLNYANVPRSMWLSIPGLTPARGLPTSSTSTQMQP